MKKLKIIGFIILKLMGAFHLSWLLNRRKLRILGYHGFSIDNQHEFEDILFMRKETFDRRMKILKQWNMNVIPLAEAVEKLPTDQHPHNGVVITFDDGWFTTAQAIPALKKYNYPATIYVSSYYSVKGVNVFNVLMRYMFWQTKSSGLHIQSINPEIDGFYIFPDSQTKHGICQKVINYGNKISIAAKEELAMKIAMQLGIDLADIDSKRMFQYLDVSELSDLKPHGLTCELHTHRHVFPLNHEQAEKEITENRESLKLVEDRQFDHLCYPSGVYSRTQIPLLKKMGIKSATTTRNGLNSPTTSMYELNRFLDRETMSDLEFEAEICGLTELLRKVLRPMERNEGLLNPVSTTTSI